METKLLEIEGITLLSVEEARKLPEVIRACGRWWWLRSPGYDSDRAQDVSKVGDINHYGDELFYDDLGVRPALIIPELEDLDLEEFKDSVEIFGVEWIYIGEGMVLAEEPIFYSGFDEDSNDYETSEIKLKLEDWLKLALDK